MDTIAETGMSLLEHPQAQSLLAEAQVTAAQVQGCRRRLGQFLERYVPLFYRKEQGHNARIVVEGLLSGLERKTAEPIAREHGVPRKPIQFFVGSGKWDDEAVMAELRRHVVETRRLAVPFRRAGAWAAAQPASRWEEFTIQDGEKGPIQVQAVLTAVQTRQDQRVGPQEWLIVIRHLESEDSEPDVSYHLAWAPRERPLEQWVQAHARRHQIEQMLAHGKGEAGLAHYEVRSYVGWHHHMTLSLLALWFLNLERVTIGEENTGGDGAANASDLGAAVAASGPDRPTDCAGSQRRAPTQRTSQDLPLACAHRPLPATSSPRRLGIKQLQ